MKTERRSEIAEYIAAGIRFAARETKLQWPEDIIIVAKSFSELVDLNEILGIRVYVMDMPSSYDFFIAFPAENEISYKLQKAFLEYMDLYDLPEDKG